MTSTKLIVHSKKTLQELMDILWVGFLGKETIHEL